MKSSLAFLLLLVYHTTFPQEPGPLVNRLKEALADTNDDQLRVSIMATLCGQYSTISFDSAESYGHDALILTEKIDFISGRISALCMLGVAYTRNGDMAKALQLEFSALKLAQDYNMPLSEGLCYYCMSKTYYFLKDYSNSISYGSRARQLFHQPERYENGKEQLSDYEKIEMEYHFRDTDLVLGEAFMAHNQLDSALVYFRKLYYDSTAKDFRTLVTIFLGDASFRSGERKSGIAYLRDALKRNLRERDHYQASWPCSILARCYSEMNQHDSAIYFAKLGLNEAQQAGFKDRILYTARLLADEYEHINLKEAHTYLQLATAVNDELFGPEKVFELQKTLSDAQLQQLETEKKQITYRNTIRQYSLLSGLVVILGVALILYRNNSQKQKANLVLETTLSNLKSAQSQLIQSEKMASLGELTAGIAHEIQNPLNFVNNFSEVNKELISELKSATEKGSLQEIKVLASDIESNEEKINHHGKRADAIVKGMLQHSRSSSGQKEPTDINALCDEYLRLAYHGLRAKDKSFNAKFETDFDASLPKINVIPQDIGRVILNLINNAFYAVSEKASNVKLQGSSFEPVVLVSTKKMGDKIQISVKDNGNGIPDTIKEKIFQPFFTTKPAGQGTGLGLSLSYDVMKAHGGELKVQTKEREGSEFVIQLTYR